MRIKYTDIDEALTAFKQLYVDADAYPALTDDELTAILTNCRVKDSDGNLITDDDYTLTIQMELAAYRAWAMKKGRAVAAVDFSADDQSFSRSQITQHCQLQMDHYKAFMVTGW